VPYLYGIALWQRFLRERELMKGGTELIFNDLLPTAAQQRKNIHAFPCFVACTSVHFTVLYISKY
jgi:hypothetical protein